MAWQIFLASRLGLDLGDLEFLRGKAMNGNLIFANGNRTTTGVITSYTPATGKTFFLIAGSIHVTSVTLGNTCRVELRNDTAVRETLGGDTIQGGSTQGADVPWKGRTIVMSDRLVGNSIKVYDLNLAAVANYTVFGSIFGWIEDT